MNQPDEDALWRSIVENYGERAMPDPGPDPIPGSVSDPVSDAMSDPGPAPDEAASRGRGDERPTRDPDRIVESPDPDRLDAWDDPEDHFVPPEPPPLPRLEPPQLLAWAGVFGVPVLAVVLTVLHVAVPGWASLLALVWFLGGFGFLVATMRRDRDEDEWDDGAVL